MLHPRINFIGASGTGKTTLGRAVAAHLGLPYFDSDDYFHLSVDPPFSQQRAPEERWRLITEHLVQHPAWVLSGAVANWRPQPVLDYTLIVFLYLPPELRLERLRRRERGLYGPRIAEGGDMEKEHREFMEWTAGYDAGTCAGTNTLSHHQAILQNAHCRTLRLVGAMELEDELARVLRELRD